MRDRSDEQLMKTYAGGSIEAFEVLYERHRGPLYRYILRLVGNPATANDLFQGSWEKIIKARGRYRDSAPFRAWMYRIAHNHVMDHFRREQPIADTPAAELADKQAGPDERISVENRRQNLIVAIENLPAEQKDTLMLKLKAGLDLQTIADVTGVNRETAKSRLRYAVKKLNCPTESGLLRKPSASASQRRAGLLAHCPNLRACLLDEFPQLPAKRGIGYLYAGPSSVGNR